MASTESFDLAELSDRANVSVRTVRYYIQQGLLPSPEARGPGAHYGPEHLDRLNLIRQLQREHLPLAEIRRRLEHLSAQEIRELLEQSKTRAPSAATDYIRSALAESQPAYESSAAAMHFRQIVKKSAVSPSPSLSAPLQIARSQWDRIVLAPDVELHIRRPLAREQNKQVERLLEAARSIFEVNTP